MGHNNIEHMKKLLTSVGIPVKESSENCEHCVTEKAKRKSVKKFNTQKRVKAFELGATDVYGPVNEPSFGGMRYCILFIDVHARYASVYFMKSKSESLDCMKQFVADVLPSRVSREDSY